MIEFFNKLFGRQSSGATAKERLRLVLMSDHLSLAPEMVDAMKRDLVDVISRYVEVDRDKIDVHFEHQDKALAMLANIPITGVNRNGTTAAANGTNGHYANGHSAVAVAEPLNHPEVSTDSEESKGDGIAAVAESHSEVSTDPEESKGDAIAAQPELVPAPAKPPQPKAKPATAKNAARPRRRRRRSV